MPRILLIEPAPDQAGQIGAVLRAAGLEVIHERHAGLALALAREHLPDAVLIDAFLPEMDGFLATRQITRDSRTRDIPVIMLAFPDPGAHKVRALWYGARDLVAKPFDERALRTVLLPLLSAGARPARAAASGW